MTQRTGQLPPAAPDTASAPTPQLYTQTPGYQPGPLQPEERLHGVPFGQHADPPILQYPPREQSAPVAASKEAGESSRDEADAAAPPARSRSRRQ